MSIDNQTERASEEKPFVLIREDRDLSLSYYFSSYMESTTSQSIEHRGKGVVALFLYEPTARANALYQGWRCITEDYYQKEEAAAQAAEKETLAAPPISISIDTTPAKKKAASKRSVRKRK